MLPSTSVVLDEFLVAEEWHGLLQYTLNREAEFVGTRILRPDGTGEVDLGYRRSRVLFDLGYYHRLFVDRIMAFLPYVLTRLGHASFSVSIAESQLTATNNNEYFKAHLDNDADEFRRRALTFVYFFYFEPKPFSGGELRIFDPQPDGIDRYASNRPYQLIEPSQNKIAFFPSGLLHEILPVRTSCEGFRASRFTVNGWLHK